MTVTKHGDTRAEAAGLRWITVPGGPSVPAVLGEDPLVTAFVEETRATQATAEEFGRRLAVLHAAGAPAFGSPPPGGPRDALIGRAPMVDEPAPDWAAWYRADRVLPYVRLARDAGTLSAEEVTVIERARIDAPVEPPARLHGDLWSGNVLWAPPSAGGAHLIDPAAHGGHRETDLAMLALFGLPHLERVLAAYDEAAPLGAGWRDRVPMHQLFPLLVHVVLFGRGYVAAALAAAR